MHIRSSIPILFAFLYVPAVFAADAACEPVLKASEARISQPAWHSISKVGAMSVEMIKADNQFFRKVGDKWTKFPVNIDDTERKFIAQMRSGEGKLTECKVVGSDIVDGVPVTIISSRTELKGAPPAESKLAIGKLDGLPYRLTGNNVTAVYSYKGVVAPPL